jgi:hypothetical protein
LRRPYRCGACQWRGWLLVQPHEPSVQGWAIEVEVPDVERIDARVNRIPSVSRPK